MRFRVTSLLAVISLVIVSCTSGAATPPAPTSTSTAVPPSSTATTSSTVPPPAEPPTRTVALDELQLWAFPGPEHYEGDVLTFEVPVGGFGTLSLVDATISVDGVTLEAEPFLSGDPLLGDYLVFADVYPTKGAVGGHWVEVTATLEPGVEIDITQRIVVRPAAGRPGQELDTAWAVTATACCNITYQENTAAARDLDELVAIIDESAAAVEAHFGLGLAKVDFVLIDTLWGNGGYAGSEVVVSYLDRDYSPGRGPTFRQTVLHELAHAATDQLEFSTPWPLIEGVAVQFTGGHFKPEPLGRRARALADRGELPDLADLFDTFPEMQHESRYAAVGAFTEYLVVTYGFDELLDLFDSDLPLGGSDWLDAAAREALGVDLESLQEGFSDWVGSFEAAEQAADLDLTIALQQARRAFQVAHNPYPNFFIYPSVTETGQDSLAMRDPSSPRLVAVEALIAHAQDLIIEGNLVEAAVAVAEVERVVRDGTVGFGISAEFLAAAEAVAAAGYELVEYEPGAPTALVVAAAPTLAIVDLDKSSPNWVVTGARPA